MPIHGRKLVEYTHSCLNGQAPEGRDLIFYSQIRNQWLLGDHRIFWEVRFCPWCSEPLPLGLTDALD
ncbi:hypothetical protein LCGC14_1257070 [marine sediment metagenome]|uniref:Uncharacterized protein n=1 Tax=marine sediment metagenome TaxID=412755 RepID=A0A0F9NIF7_9ZZZZ